MDAVKKARFKKLKRTTGLDDDPESKERFDSWTQRDYLAFTACEVVQRKKMIEDIARYARRCRRLTEKWLPIDTKIEAIRRSTITS